MLAIIEYMLKLFIHQVILLYSNFFNNIFILSTFL